MPTFSPQVQKAIDTLLEGFKRDTQPKNGKGFFAKYSACSCEARENDCYQIIAKFPLVKMQLDLRLHGGANPHVETLKAKCGRTPLGKMLTFLGVFLAFIAIMWGWDNLSKCIAFGLQEIEKDIVGVSNQAISYVIKGLLVFLGTFMAVLVCALPLILSFFFKKTLRIFLEGIPGTLDLLLKNEKSFVITEQPGYSLQGLNAAEIADRALKELPQLIPQMNGSATCQLAPHIDQIALTNVLARIAPGTPPENVIAVIDFPAAPVRSFDPNVPAPVPEPYADAVFITMQGFCYRKQVLSGMQAELLCADYKHVNTLVPGVGFGCQVLTAKTLEIGVPLLKAKVNGPVKVSPFAKMAPLQPYNENLLRASEILVKFVSAMRMVK